MINLMIDNMSDNDVYTIEYESDVRRIATRLLDKMEESGMTPPYNTRVITDGYTVAFLEWEKE